MARRIVRAWWGSLAWLAFGVIDLLLLLAADDVAPRVLGVVACIGAFGLAAWHELNAGERSACSMPTAGGGTTCETGLGLRPEDPAEA